MAGADTISVPVPSCTYTTSIQPDGAYFTASGYAPIHSPGNPALLYKDIQLLLPPNADLKSLSVNLAGAQILTSAVPDVAPAPPIMAQVGGEQLMDWGSNKDIVSGRNSLVYCNDSFYPTTHVEILDAGNLRKWRIATIRYYPLLYNPVSHELQSSTSGEIIVSYALGVTQASVNTSNDTLFEDTVKRIASNFSQARNWYNPSSQRRLMDIPPPSIPDYVIITTSAIVSGSMKLQAFADHKSKRGFNVDVITESQWGGGIGDTAANNIRRWLQANYLIRNIKYVLLIGNPAPNTGDVPMKMLWPRYNEDTYREAPSDYYYADLTGNWDMNGDGYFGEENSDFGPGGVDRFPEVIVGRIPFYGNFSDLDSILQKTIDYESGALGGGWIRNILLSMKPSDSSTPGYQLGEAIKTDAAVPASIKTTRIYDDTYNLNPPPEIIPCTSSSVLSAWQRHAGFHFWWAHGNDTVASDVFSSDSCQSLDNNYPSFTFQCSCLNANPDNPNNLAYSLLKQGAVATDAATRVSWYYPGEVSYLDSDSNAGMAYDYALRLIRDHMPCGDAHFAMMLDIPDSIWMNHCVFNLYGDPSLAYLGVPVISSKPLNNTDNTSAPYQVLAGVTTSVPLAQGNPVLEWNTDGGSTFTSVPMTPIDESAYSAYIPAQPYGTVVYYYIHATDTANQMALFPDNAPQSLLSFRVGPDTQPPTITHTSLTDTGDKFGPYPVMATITDDLGVASATLFYNINGSSYTALPMNPKGSDVYEADIPGGTKIGDKINYFITATDVSGNANTSRLPASGCFSFSIVHKICVAVYNSNATPSYFVGGNLNIYSQVADILNSDPAQRFQVTVITDFNSGPSSPGLVGQDALILPDNVVPVSDMQTVADWFRPGKVIMTLDSATSYAAYSGFMWPSSAGSNGWGVYWDYNAGYGDQEIWLQDPITTGYSVGQVICTSVFDAQFFVRALPSDAHVLTGSQGDPTRCYAAYRDVPDHGRFVILGPYVSVCTDEVSIVREAAVPPPTPRSLTITSPNGGESYETGSNVEITYSTSGMWDKSDMISLEYTSGLNSTWHTIPGAETLPYDACVFNWNTSGLPGSYSYKVRVNYNGGEVFDESDAVFSIIPTIDIPTAKSIADGQIVKLDGKVVTCTAPDFTYIEEPNRLAGIKISSASGLEPSALVSVTGIINTVNGEKVLNAEWIDLLGVGAQIKPYCMKTENLGGGKCGLQSGVVEYRIPPNSTDHTLELLPAGGANNIGLLVRVFGRVTFVGQDYFYIDDGSGCNDDSGSTGVRVWSGSIPLPTQGQYVLIEAISTTYFNNGNLFRALVLPDKNYLHVVPE